MTTATTIYQVRISSRERPEESSLEMQYDTYAAAFEHARRLNEEGTPAFVSEYNGKEE